MCCLTRTRADCRSAFGVNPVDDGLYPVGFNATRMFLQFAILIRSQIKMHTNSHLSKKVAFATAATFAALMTVSCVSTRSSPQQVDVSNPTVTYKYRNDDELIQANMRAMTYCDQYQSLPQTEHFGHDSDGSNIVVFGCLARSASAAPRRQLNSDLTYNFQTDQELLDVSRDAQVYCLNSGQPDMGSTIVVHSNGSKTVTFGCSRR